jgi:hypothetical protein
MSINLERVSVLNKRGNKHHLAQHEPLPGLAVAFDGHDDETYGIILSIVDEHNVLVLWSKAPSTRARTTADMVETMRNEIMHEVDREIIQDMVGWHDLEEEKDVT